MSEFLRGWRQYVSNWIDAFAKYAPWLMILDNQSGAQVMVQCDQHTFCCHDACSCEDRTGTISLEAGTEAFATIGDRGPTTK